LSKYIGVSEESVRNIFERYNVSRLFFVLSMDLYGWILKRFILFILFILLYYSLIILLIILQEILYILISIDISKLLVNL